MKIAQICPYDFDRPGGVQVHIRDTAIALQELGCEVTVIAPRVDRDDAIPPPPGVTLVKVGRTRKVGFAGTAFELSLATGDGLLELEALLAPGRFDVVHFHSVWTPVMPMQAFLASRTAKVATVHETPPEGAGGLIPKFGLRALSLLTFPYVDAVIGVSEAPLTNVIPARGQPVFVLPPCTDLRRFAEAPPPRRETGDERTTILFAGRLEPRKGAMSLLQAFHRLRQDGLAVRLLIAGTGQEEGALRRYVAEHRVSDVEFTGGFQDPDAPDLFGASDIFCAPSLYGESFGIVIAEAMAAGRPVVAAGNRGYRTLLTGEGARFLTPPGDVDALHVALRDLAVDPVLRLQLGAWGRREALKYDCRQVAPKLVEVYAQAIARRASRFPLIPGAVLAGSPLDEPAAGG